MEERKERVIGLLRTTYTCSSKSQRQQAEAQLQSLVTDVGEFVVILLEIANSATTAEMRKSACVQAREVIKLAVNANRISPAQRLTISELLFLCLRNLPHLRDVLILCVSAVLLNTDNNQHVDTTRFVLDLSAKAVASNSLDAQAGLRIISDVFTNGSLNNTATFIRFFQDCSAHLAAVAINSARELESQQSMSSSGTVQALAVIEEWTNAMHCVFKHFEENLPKSMRELTNDVSIANAFERLLLLPAGQTLFATSPDRVAATLNSSKTRLMETTTLIFKYLTEKRQPLEDQEEETVRLPGLPLPPSPFLSCISRLIEPWVFSLSAVCSVHLSTVFMSNSLSTLVTAVLKLLHECCAEIAFESAFVPCYKNLVSNVCIPLMSASKQDLKMMKVESQEFCNLTSDVCTKQKSNVPKTGAAQLLDTLCMQVDGALSFTIAFLAQLLDFTTSGSYDYQSYSVLAAIVGSLTMLKLPPELRFETALLTFCALSSKIRERRDLSQVLRYNFSQYFALLRESDFDIVRCRLCLFLGHFISDFFTSDNMVKEGFTFLMQCLQSSSETLSQQASFALSLVLEKEKTLPESCAESVLRGFLTILPQKKDKAFFSGLWDLVKAHELAVFACCPDLVQVLSTLIAREAELECKKPGRSDGSLMKECWTIMKEVLKFPSVPVQFSAEIDAAFLPLQSYLSLLRSLTLEDELVSLWTILVLSTKYVVSGAWQLLTLLPALQRKNGGDLRLAFRLLNAVLAFARSQVFTTPDLLRELLEMSSIALFATEAGYEQQSSQSEGLLIMQQLLLLAPPASMDAALPTVFEVLLRRCALGCKNFMKVRVLETFLAAIRYNLPLAMSVLKDMNEDQRLFSEITENWRFFVHDYDKKLATGALIDVIVTENAEYPLVELLNALIGILSLRSPAPSSDGVSTPQRSSEELASCELLSSMISPLEAFDELSYFRSFLASFAQTHPEFLQRLHTLLPEERLQQLKSILQSHRLQENCTTVRRIVKVKRVLT